MCKMLWRILVTFNKIKLHCSDFICISILLVLGFDLVFLFLLGFFLCVFFWFWVFCFFFFFQKRFTYLSCLKLAVLGGAQGEPRTSSQWAIRDFSTGITPQRLSSPSCTLLSKPERAAAIPAAFGTGHMYRWRCFLNIFLDKLCC